MMMLCYIGMVIVPATAVMMMLANIFACAPDELGHRATQPCRTDAKSSSRQRTPFKCVMFAVCVLVGMGDLRATHKCARMRSIDSEITRFSHMGARSGRLTNTLGT